jgi:hypothetical protein
MEAQMKKSIVGNLVKFTFDENVPALTFDCTKMSEANRAYAIPFGMCHRLGDMAALSRKQSDGTIVTITEAMRRASIEEGCKHYESGTLNWDMHTVRVPVQNPVIQQIADKLGITYEAAQAKIAEQFLNELA